MLRHFWPRQRGGHGTGARARPATSLLSLPKRASHGPYRRRFQQSKFPAAHFSLHNFDRTWRDQYGHWGSVGNHQPPACAVVARGYFRQKKRFTGFAATGISCVTRHFRKRLLQARFTLLGPHPASGTNPYYFARIHARAYFTGIYRGGNAELAARRTNREL